MSLASVALAQEFAAFRGEFNVGLETALGRAFAETADTPVHRAAQYAALSGGRRWRGMLAIAAGRVFNPRAMEIAMPCACAIELAHAASLVLDDLPSMDNAEIRRGKRCVHLEFPRWAADMAPVFLVTLAYQVSLANPLASPESRVAAALELSRAGLQMTHGQAVDLALSTGELSAARLLECSRLKTGALSAAAAKAGAIVCGADCEGAGLLESFGLRLGVAYQILDDVADRNGSLAVMGKRPNMDAAKTTAVDLFGVDGAKRKALEFWEEALAHVQRFGGKADFLRGLVHWTGWASRV